MCVYLRVQTAAVWQKPRAHHGRTRLLDDSRLLPSGTPWASGCPPGWWPMIISAYLSSSIGANSAGASGNFAPVLTEEPGQTSRFARYLSGACFDIWSESAIIALIAFTKCSPLPPVSEMTYTVSSGTLNSTIPYHSPLPVSSAHIRRVGRWFITLQTVG